MEKRQILENIIEVSAMVITQGYIVDKGQKYNVGEPHARAYMNSEEERIELKEQYSNFYKLLINSVWGDHPKYKQEQHGIQ